MNKFQEKYIPKEFRDITLDGKYGANKNTTKILHAGGCTNRTDTVHAEPIYGYHQGWSSPASLHQIVLPNDDRVIVSYMGYTLIEQATAHISSKTGVVTLLDEINGSAHDNKTFSELFGATVRNNLTDFPFNQQRIGDYAAVPGLQFTCLSGRFKPTNPILDWRIKTNRVISMRVRKKLREVAEVVEGKAELIHGMHHGGEYEKRKYMSERVHALTRNSELANSINYYYPTVASFTRPRDLIDKSFGGATPHDGLVLKLRDSGPGPSVINTINGDLNHELLALLIAQAHTTHIWTTFLNMAPLFIAARGGYSLTKVEKGNDRKSTKN